MNRRVIAILLILAFTILVPSIASAQEVRIPDSNYYVYLTTPGSTARMTVFNPRSTIEVHLINRGAGDIVYWELRIYDPNNNLILTVSSSMYLSPNSDAAIYQYTLPPESPPGKWRVEINVRDSTGSYPQAVIYFEVPGPTTTTTPPPPPPVDHIIPYIIIGVALVATVVIVAAVLYYMRKPEKAPEAIPLPAPVQPPAPAPPAPRAGEETVVTPAPVTPAVSAPAVGGETVVALAKLVTPQGEALPITSLRQAFGREDFQRYVIPDQARLISRRSTPQFEIYFDLSTRQFYIVDNNSANGTYLNGVNIRGRGPQPLKDGDRINPAGVLELVFQTS